MEDSNDLDWRLEYAINSYLNEAESMHKIKDRVSYVMGLFITPVSGAIYFLYTTFKGVIFETHNILLFALPLSTAAAIVLLSTGKLFFLLRKAHEYSTPPLPSQLSKYYNSIDNKPEALTSLKMNLLNSYEAAVDHNSNTNEIRSRAIINAQQTAA